MAGVILFRQFVQSVSRTLFERVSGIRPLRTEANEIQPHVRLDQVFFDTLAFPIVGADIQHGLKLSGIRRPFVQRVRFGLILFHPDARVITGSKIARPTNVFLSSRLRKPLTCFRRVRLTRKVSAKRRESSYRACRFRSPRSNLWS